jgi:hypothetical protein
LAVPLEQASFIGGEIDPALHARKDLERYHQAAAKIENFIVRPTGGVVNRAGMRFLAETPDSSAVRLIPFIFSTAPGQSYVLEFSPLKIRFYAFDQALGIAGLVLDGSAPYEVATSYEAADLAGLRYAQAGDILTLVHRNHPPKELRRLDHTDWQLTDLVVTRSIEPPTGLVAVQLGAPAVDATHPLRDVEYVVTAVRRLANGDPGDESLPSAPISVALQDYADRPDTKLSWSLPAGTAMDNVERFNIYKGRQGSFGFVGYTKGVAEFHDKAYAPVLNDTPPSGRNPFGELGSYPSLVAYFEQRQVFAASEASPTTLWFSKTGAIRNFDVSRVPKDDDAITLVLASLQVDEVRALIPMRSLLALTSSAEWAVSGGDSSPLTPTAMQARPHSFEGSEAVPPIVIANSALFVARGVGVRSLAFDWQQDSYATKDLSILASHLFEGKSVVSWAYAAKPFRCAWVVLDDGSMVALTYVREHEVWAWHRHSTNGAVEQVCAVPEGHEDGVYFVVLRDGQRYVERMAERLVDQIDGCFLDSALTLDGRNANEGRILKFANGSTWAEDSEADVVSSGFSTGPFQFTAGDVGARVTIDGVTAEILTIDDPLRAHVRFLDDCPAEARDFFSGNWSIARKALAGLDHLEGRVVRACVDGNAHPERTVAAGRITLQQHATVIHVGLPFVSELVALPARVERTSNKVIASVSLDLLDSRGLQVGVKEQRLYAQTSRTVLDGWSAGALRTGLEEISVSSDYSTSGQWVVRQYEPLPACVLSVIPKLEGSRVF